MISEKEVLDVREPPGKAMGKVAELWKPVEGTNKIMCTACARYCKIGEGQVGLCGIRGVHEGKLWLYVYGRVITGHVDPIEKKPVSHYRPGSKIFSIATTGCNWLCHPAGTPILLNDGSTKPVEEIRRGDALWSLSDLEGRTAPAIVTKAGSRKAQSFRLSAAGLSEPLLATGEHPVFTPRGWVPLAGLQQNDLILFSRGENSDPLIIKPPFIPAHGSAFHAPEMARFWELSSRASGPAPRFAWSPITGVSRESQDETVYSFECVPFHNYVASDVVVHNCRYCFLPGTQISTYEGHVAIDRIFAESEATSKAEVRKIRNRKVLTHRGRWRNATKAFQHLYSGKILRIRPFYLPGLDCTPDHHVFASLGGKPVRKVRASELKLGDFLAVPRQRAGGNSTIEVKNLFADLDVPNYKHAVRLDLSRGRIRWSSERGRGIPARIRLTADLSRLLGYYCAEGSVNWHRRRANSGAVWFSFGAHEETRIREVERLLNEIFEARTRRSRQVNRVAVIASGASLATFFRSLCGESSATKHVPTAVLTSRNQDVLKGFVTGYFNGDGYLTRRRGNGYVLGSTSVSQRLTFGVAHLLLALGEVPRVYRSRNKTSYEIEGRTVSRSDDHMIHLFVDEASLDPEEIAWTSSNVRVLQNPDYLLIPIRSIEESDYVGPVYNIEVEQDHSYTANFMAVSNCQNADISQRRKVEGIEVEPQDVVRMTLEQGCQGLAYTYNQPTIFIEFARDIGMRARKAGLINIFVSNGYDTPETVAEMPKFLDCVTVDFKGSGETNFVRKYINIPNAEPIFQTLLDTRDTKKIHIEITDLIVPQVGDDLGAARKLSKWVYDNLGPDTPIHFLRFHPDYKMMEFPWTPVETLEKHCAVAKEEGLKYVYIGNVSGHPLENTYCPGCGAVAIKRYGFDITGWYLDKDNKCKKCGYKLAIFGRLERTAKENRFYSVLYHR